MHLAVGDAVRPAGAAAPTFELITALPEEYDAMRAPLPAPEPLTVPPDPAHGHPA
jgi:hypothetical protein